MNKKGKITLSVFIVSLVLVSLFLIPISANGEYEWDEDINAGLIHYWNFDEGSGSIAEDLISGNNLTFVNGTSWNATGVYGSDADFD